MIDGAVRRTVSSGEVELALVEAGDPQRETIVFVHGYPDTKEIWEPVMAPLAGRFHVAAYDVRGAGNSTAPRGPRAYGMERLADDLLAVIDAVSPNGRVHLVGHDWGGIAGWELATMPRVVERLASFTTIAGPSLLQLSAAVRGRLRRGRLLDVADRLRRSWYVLALGTPGVPMLAWRLGPGRRWRSYLQLVERLPVDHRYPAATLSADAIHGANLYRRNILGRIGRRDRPEIVPIPVQLIVPSGDRFISPKYYEDAERYAPRLRRRTVPGSHWAPRSQPTTLARWIAEFVEDSEHDRVGPARAWCRGGGTQQLDGRLALVTGAGSGIGRATAQALADRGARLLLVDRDAQRAARSAESITGSRALHCDVSDRAAMERLAEQVLAEHGVPDVIVNNAGIAVVGTFMQTEFEDWRRVIDVNLMGVVHGCRLFGGAMAERGEGGHIVNIASAAAFAPSKELTAYHASKAAVLMLSECIRAELIAHGIGVTAVCPGVIATNITRNARYAGRDEAAQERLRAYVTRAFERRNFRPEQVATEIVAAIGRDAPVVVITPEAKLLRALSRYSPSVMRRLAQVDALPL